MSIPLLFQVQQTARTVRLLQTPGFPTAKVVLFSDICKPFFKFNILLTLVLKFVKRLFNWKILRTFAVGMTGYRAEGVKIQEQSDLALQLTFS